jgi:hypothetical protein
MACDPTQKRYTAENHSGGQRYRAETDGKLENGCCCMGASDVITTYPIRFLVEPMDTCGGHCPLFPSVSLISWSMEIFNGQQKAFRKAQIGQMSRQQVMNML